MQHDIISKRLKECRRANHLSQQEVANALKVQRQIISYFETGKRQPNITDLIELAKLYNVSTDYLLGLTGTQSPDPDVRVVCNYTGLEEESLKYLRLNKYFMHPVGRKQRYNHINQLPEFIVYTNDTYHGIYKKVVNNFLQSDCFLHIITSCCSEKVLEYCYNELNDFKLSGKKFCDVSRHRAIKLDMFFRIFEDYFKQNRLDLFFAQDAIAEFIDSITFLKDKDPEEISELIKYVEHLNLEDEETEDNYYNGKEKIFGYNIDDIDSLADFCYDENDDKVYDKIMDSLSETDKQKFKQKIKELKKGRWH